MQADGLSDTGWPRLSEYIAQHIGLYYPPERRLDLQRGLSRVAAEFGFANIATCADWLLSGALTQAQMRTLAGHLTVGETYFFREPRSFDALREHILPELIGSRRGREQRLRLWSAACSTGEEAYSLAILLRQLIPDWQDWCVRILATDINEQSLQTAREGVYGKWALRDSTAGFRDTYFTRTAAGRFALLPEIKRCVEFAQLNLAQDCFPSLSTHTNAMDIILCRNLLIYFAPTQAQTLVQNLHHALVDEAWLIVSPSECSQVLFRGFRAVNFPGAILYRKGTDAQQTQEHGSPSRLPEPVGDTDRCVMPMFDTSPPAALRVARAVTLKSAVSPRAEQTPPVSEPSEGRAEAEALYGQGRYAEAAERLLSFFAWQAVQNPTSTSGSGAESPTFSLLTRALANQGKLIDALAWSKRWIGADRLDSAAYYLHAVVLQELGEFESARRSLQRAVYLHPDFVLAHFALGNLARSGGRIEAAKKHFENAQRLLRGSPPGESLPESDGMTAGRLAEIIAALLVMLDRPVALLEESPHETRAR
jgi:chemotaxis protein methyltransferase CheR